MGGCCDFCCIGDCCVLDFGSSGGGCSYTPTSKSDEKAAKKLADELADIKTEYEEKAKVAEDLIIREVSVNMDSLIEAIKKINEKEYGGRKLSINIKSLEERRDSLKNQVRGHISSVMHDRLTMTDPELSVILNEKNDDERSKKYHEFCDRLEASAKESLKEKVRNVADEQLKLVRSEIEHRIEDITRSLEASRKVYEDLVAANDKSIEEKDKLIVELMYKHGIYDRIGVFLGI